MTNKPLSCPYLVINLNGKYKSLLYFESSLMNRFLVWGQSIQHKGGGAAHALTE